MFETKTKKVNTDELKFGESGLVCVIAQDYESGEVLLQSYMNRECVDKTFASGYVYYYDPASGLPRKKGEASGNTQKVVTAFLDDDKDCLLLKVRKKGFACHTGTYTCFAEQIKGEDNEIGGEMFGKLQRIVEERKKNPDYQAGLCIRKVFSDFPCIGQRDCLSGGIEYPVRWRRQLHVIKRQGCSTKHHRFPICLRERRD